MPGAIEKADGAGSARTGLVMLALSTFRQSGAAARLAMEKAAKTGRLVVVFIVDSDLARYISFEELGVLPEREEYEKELLETHERLARTRMKLLLRMARKRGIKVGRRIRKGGFGIECVKLARKLSPSLVVTTRSARPAFLRRVFGSPVDYLIANAGCPVIEA